MTIPECVTEVGERLHGDYGDRPIPRADIVAEVLKIREVSADSIQPADHCYNRRNNGINSHHVPMFLHTGSEKSGLYKFVGLQYFYTGPVEEYPQDHTPQ